MKLRILFEFMLLQFYIGNQKCDIDYCREAAQKDTIYFFKRVNMKCSIYLKATIKKRILDQRVKLGQ